MKNLENKSQIEIMYETVMERGGPQGPFSQAVVDAYEGKSKQPKEQKAVVQFAGMGSGISRIAKKFLNKNKKNLDEQEKQFREGPITSQFLEEVDDEVIEKFIRTRDMSGSEGYGLYEDFADMPAGLKAAELIKRVKGKNNSIDYERAEMFIGTKLKGTETIDELIEMVTPSQKPPTSQTPSPSQVTEEKAFGSDPTDLGLPTMGGMGMGATAAAGAAYDKGQKLNKKYKQEQKNKE